jgi:two-component system, cell cycle response regulator
VTETRARILVVDDSAVNRKLLERLLEREGHFVETATQGREALDRVNADPGSIDVVLLDIVMPELDGYAVLQQLKSDEHSRHLPVIMISSIEEVASVTRCIEDGATDYLTKPFDPAILHARLSSSLAEKRLRDTEREYLQQVQVLTGAAAAIEDGDYDASRLEGVAGRDDPLGQLARVFQRMAKEVRAREERLTRQVAELRIEIDEARKSTQVAQIIGTEYFRGLREQAADLRREL